MVKSLSRYSKWIIAGFGFLVFGLTETEWLKNLPLWQRPEGISIDFRYAVRGARFPDPNIKLIGLETSSFQLDELSTNEIAASPTLRLMQQPWPWDRRVYVAILEKLMRAGAKVVVFDFVYASQTDGDDEFAAALNKYKDRVVIGEMFADEKEAAQFKTKKLTTPNARLLLPGTDSVVGLVNLWPDLDQIVRSVKYHTSLEHEAGLESSGSAEDLIHITALAVKKFTGQDASPPNDQLHFIDFQGSTGVYRPFVVESMFVNELWQAPPFNGGMAFSNKIVVVGPVAEIFHDIHTTPFGDTPGPEIQAQIMAALLHGSWLSGTSPPINLTLAFLMLALGLGICLQIKDAIGKTVLLAATVVVFFVFCQVGFTYFKLVLPMTQPLACLMVPASFGIVFQYALEQFERMRYRNVLGRYVSENVAKAVLEDKRSFEESLRGQKKPVTILFSDIRGFTSMTESTDADKLVAQLNEYFGEMVKIIEEKNRGTLQKFIGDAIMAAWGDVYSDGIEVDARRAVASALEMRAALVKLNDGWKNDPDRRILATGIGVNHGEVIYGNIGSHKRMELTVLGDGVNLAARLESATKQFHTDILIGEETERLTREHFIFRSVGAIAFKGKTKPIEVFTLLGDRSRPAPAWLAKYQDGIRLFRGRQFAEAANEFEAARREIGGGDFLCDIYIERCAACIERPPPADWDGSYALTEK